jgi:hypothetical protein
MNVGVEACFILGLIVLGVNILRYHKARVRREYEAGLKAAHEVVQRRQVFDQLAALRDAERRDEPETGAATLEPGAMRYVL